MHDVSTYRTKGSANPLCASLRDLLVHLEDSRCACNAGQSEGWFVRVLLHLYRFCQASETSEGTSIPHISYSHSRRNRELSSEGVGNVDLRTRALALVALGHFDPLFPMTGRKQSETRARWEKAPVEKEIV